MQKNQQPFLTSMVQNSYVNFHHRVKQEMINAFTHHTKTKASCMSQQQKFLRTRFFRGIPSVRGT